MPLALIVDDDDDIRFLAGMALRDVGGFEIELAASGIEAIEAALRRRPDVIVLDVMMPDIDGEETLRRLRCEPRLEDVPVVFLSARAMRHELEHLRGLDVIGVLTKPFDPMTLAARVSALLAPGSGCEP